MDDLSKKLTGKTYRALGKHIFLLALVAGALCSILLDGQPAAPSGLAVALASHSALQVRKKEQKITATYGRDGLSSLKSENLQQYLVSKLRARLPLAGLISSLMTWKEKVTPAGRQYCQLVAPAPLTAETGFSLWATPNTMDYLPQRSPESLIRTSRTTRKGRARPGNLREQVDERVMSLWPTPLASDARRGASPAERQRNTPSLPVAVKIGNTLDGLLNPAWVGWLMGFPAAWVNCAPLVTPLCRKLRRSSSKHTCKSDE